MKVKIAINTQYDYKLPADTPEWSRFNDSFQNYEIAPGKIMSAIRRGYAYTPPHEHKRHILTGRNGRQRLSAYRHSLNWLAGQHLALDFDTEDEHSTFAALARNPLIAKYGAFLHTTPSHTEEAPHSRAFFILEEAVTDKDWYSAASVALVWKFGHSDRSCIDPARFYFGAKDCRIKVLGNTMPLSVLNHLINEKRDADEEEERRQRPRRTRADFDDSDPDLAEVRRALSYIPQKQDYSDWLRCLMAVWSAFPGDDGISLIEEWSPGYPGEVEKKFDSFGGRGGGQVGLGTLFWLARQHGYAPERRPTAPSVSAGTDMQELRRRMIADAIAIGYI